MAWQILAGILVGYLPGALAYRLPVADRDRRAALEADERAFWHVILSLAWSLAVVLALALAGQYQFDRLLLTNGVLSVLLGLALLASGGLTYAATAARPTWHVVLPLLLVALGVARFPPPSEFIVGGQDPGIYMNEGIQIAQRGAIVSRDPVLGGVRPEFLDLFVPRNTHDDATYYGNRFMGFYALDPAEGTVVGQFPHLYPASIAIAYGIDGLTGARRTTIVWAILGMLAVFFAGRRLFGTPTAFAGAALLGVHVVLTWYAREPNAEVVMVTFLFAGTLAFARAHQDGDRFFAPVAAVLFVLLLFLRFDTILLLAGVAAAALLCWLVQRQRLRAGFVVPLSLGALAAWWYLTGVMAGYMDTPFQWSTKLPWPVMAGGGIVGVAALAFAVRWRDRLRGTLEWLIPAAYAASLLMLAAYALFFRRHGGLLTDYDAYALRWFTELYLSWPALAAALLGLALATRRFWRDPALFLAFAAFSTFLFYKPHIVPTHFWASRRFLQVILPMALLLAAYAAYGLAAHIWPDRKNDAPGRSRQMLRLVVPSLLVAALGWHYLQQSAPIVRHVEYAGVIPYLERLAGRFTERDLVIVEARNASDMHVLATPLAYIYATPVLVLASPIPDKFLLHAFLQDAARRYEHIYFMGGGGTDLLARDISATPVGGDTVQVPEYEASAWNVYPTRAETKEFDYSIYELSTEPRPDGPFALDVGHEDDLHVLRFHAKETTEGRTVRWTSPQSQIAVIGLTGDEREIALTMHAGGRPAGAPPATVEVAFDEVTLGTITVGSGFQTYTVPLPEDLAAAAAARDVPTLLRLRSSTWRPAALVGGSDTRELGVMLDRIEIR